MVNMPTAHEKRATGHAMFLPHPRGAGQHETVPAVDTLVQNPVHRSQPLQRTPPAHARAHRSKLPSSHSSGVRRATQGWLADFIAVYSVVMAVLVAVVTCSWRDMPVGWQNGYLDGHSVGIFDTGASVEHDDGLIFV
jgi:hypothetical protein